MGDRLRRANHLSISPSHPCQLSLLPLAGREMSQPKCGDALRLGSKGRYGSFHLWINMWVAGKTVWSLVNACHTWAPYRWVMIKRCTNRCILYTYVYYAQWEVSTQHHQLPHSPAVIHRQLVLAAVNRLNRCTCQKWQMPQHIVQTCEIGTSVTVLGSNFTHSSYWQVHLML